MDPVELFERSAATLEPSGTLVGHEELVGGSSALVYALNISTPDTSVRRVVFRQYAAHFKLLLEVADRFLVMEWIDGETHVADDELDGALDQMAAFLAQLHALDPAIATKLESLEDPLAETPRYLPDDELGAQAQAALAASVVRPNPQSIIHGDYWPGNLLWCDGVLQAVIDWEDVAVGDPLADLAGARVELLCQYGQSAMDGFTDRYLTLNPVLDTTSLAIWEIYVSASALSTMHLWNLDPAEELRRRTMTQSFFEHAVSALESDIHEIPS